MSDVDHFSLLPSCLEKLRHRSGGRLLARCPACAATGGDRGGSHLVIFPDGRFACAAHPGDGGHRRHIFALAGKPLERRDRPQHDSPRHHEERQRQRREWQARLRTERQREAAANHLITQARAARQDILTRYPWTLSEAWEDSPQLPDGPRVCACPGHFLASLFPPDALLWTGAVQDSGSPRHAGRWRTCADWLAAAGDAGPMVTPAIWQPGLHSRSAAGVRSAPYVVLDFDGMDGMRPQGEEALAAHFRASLACIRWLREGLGWSLAAIVGTGGKSLHAWFHSPGTGALESLAATAAVFGIDAGLVGRPEHPCRLPGQRHAGTGRISEILWLQ